MTVKELFCAALRNAAQDRYNDLLKAKALAIMLEAQLRRINQYSTEFVFPGEKRGFIAFWLLLPMRYIRTKILQILLKIIMLERQTVQL